MAVGVGLCNLLATRNRFVMMTPVRQRLFRFWPWLVLALILVGIAGVRWRLREMPLERDEGEYAYAGQLIRAGIPPFKLVYNMKLPGTYYAYAAGLSVFGETTAGVHLTLLVVNALTVVCVFLLGRALLGAAGGLVAAVVYAVTSASPAVLGMAAHANHFVVLFAVPGVWWLWRAHASGRSWNWLVAGLLLGSAFVMKQQALAFCLLGFAVLVWSEFKRADRSLGRFYPRAVFLGAGTMLPFGVMCLLMWQAGVFSKFWFWTFSYARQYASANSPVDGLANLAAYLRDSVQWQALLGLWVLAGIGWWVARRDAAYSRVFAFLNLFLAFSFLATATGFYFRKHYFIQLLPAFAVLSGMSFCVLRRRLEKRGNSLTAAGIIGGLFLLCMAGSVLADSRFYFRQLPDEAIRTAYPDENFAATQAVAKFIRTNSVATDGVAVFGSEPQVYFLAGRRSVTGYIYTYALMESHPYAAVMQKEMAGEIEAGRPRYIVYVSSNNSWLVTKASRQDIFNWFDRFAAEQYERVGLVELESNGGFRCYWGAAANRSDRSDGHVIAVLERKPVQPLTGSAD